VLKEGRCRKAWKPQKGMSRLRERDTAPEGEDAGARPNRDSSSTLEGLSQRGDGRRNGEKRRSGRQLAWLLPRVSGEDPRGDGSSRGDRPLGGALNKHRWRYGSTAGARPWRRRKGLQVSGSLVRCLVSVIVLGKARRSKRHEGNLAGRRARGTWQWGKAPVERNPKGVTSLKYGWASG
jgi:hypothetical protein